ncbi:peptide deformylase [Rarobacter faecitabidus]|uniref:Peptide deformylase n=1 Tax=Rarobacter faecitabidus TaxID=13243 RepID=A0A542ZXH6_RARFA|nr:peptide deformylase [Rarobacter faecitabidus]TQL65058.1 peptide deformylase [Rarobacter faecitabidus]
MRGFKRDTGHPVRKQVESLLRASADGILPIVRAGDPVLRERTEPYHGQLGDLLDAFLDAMRRTMLDAPGVGLAANQVGVALQIAVIWDPGGPKNDPRERPALPHRTIINPAYEHVSSPDTGELEVRSFHEGCLSVPGYQAEVARMRAVRLRCLDEAGAAIDEVLVGWPARIVQHETDHVGGGLYLDKADLRSLATNEWLASH